MKIREVISPEPKWRWPTRQELELEYKTEYQFKPEMQRWLGDPWPRVDDFLGWVEHNSRVVKVSRGLDLDIENRSRTRSRDQLRDLISNYRSWPQYRNDSTLAALYQALGQGGTVAMPIVVRRGDRLRVMSGNTRMDIAQQLGHDPHVIMIDLD